MDGGGGRARWRAWGVQNSGGLACVRGSGRLGRGRICQAGLVHEHAVDGASQHLLRLIVLQQPTQHTFFLCDPGEQHKRQAQA